MSTLFIRFIFPLTFIFLILSSCCKKLPNISLHYSDGTVIHDSTEIYPVLREFLPLRRKHGLPVENMHIYTSLQPGTSKKLRHANSQLEQLIQPVIKTSPHDTLAKRMLKKAISNGNLLYCGVLVIDNHTGEILVNYNKVATQEFAITTDTRSLNYFNNILLYTLAMERNGNPENRYPQTLTHKNDKGIYERDTTVGRNFYSAFSKSFGGTITYGLHHLFSLKSQLSLRERLHWGESSTGNCSDPVRASLLDLTKTYTAFRNKGILHSPHLIQKVTNLNGHLLYKRRQSNPYQVIDTKTADKMMQLLDYYADFGAGASVRRAHPNAPDFYGSMMTTGLSSLNGYFITVLPDYTIGVYYQINAVRVRYKKLAYSSMKTVLTPLWLKTIQFMEAHRKYTINTEELPRLCSEPEQTVIPIREENDLIKL